MRPGGVHIFFLLNTSLRETQVRFFDVGKRSEDVLLNHLDNIVQIGNNQTHNVLLVLENLLELVDGLQAVSLSLDIF